MVLLSSFTLRIFNPTPCLFISVVCDANFFCPEYDLWNVVEKNKQEIVFFDEEERPMMINYAGLVNFYCTHSRMMHLFIHEQHFIDKIQCHVKTMLFILSHLDCQWVRIYKYRTIFPPLVTNHDTIFRETSSASVKNQSWYVCVCMCISE